MNSPITDAAQALAGLLRAAEDGDLPMPYSVTATNYAPDGHEASHGERYRQGGIDLLVHTLADLTAWSTWLDSPIDDSADPHNGNVHCHVHGYAGPVPVTVTALVPIAEPVSA